MLNITATWVQVNFNRHSYTNAWKQTQPTFEQDYLPFIWTACNKVITESRKKIWFTICYSPRANGLMSEKLTNGKNCKKNNNFFFIF